MNYQEMDVYKQAYQASLRIHYLIEGDDDLRGQVKRASRDVAAIIAQSSNALNSMTETKDILVDAARGVDQVMVWLDFCRDLDVLDANAAQSLKSEYSKITDALAVLWNKSAAE